VCHRYLTPLVSNKTKGTTNFVKVIRRSLCEGFIAFRSWCAPIERCCCDPLFVLSLLRGLLAALLASALFSCFLSTFFSCHLDLLLLSSLSFLFFVTTRCCAWFDLVG